MERIGVVGAGQMGSGIAEVAARAGSEVVVVEVVPEALERGRTRIEGSLAKAVERGKLDAAERDAAMERLTFGSELDAMTDCEMVIEAVVEDEAVKREIFAVLDGLVAADAVLATNTSSIPITRIALATNRPDRVIGVHFFNPVPVLQLVEIIPGIATSEDTVERATSYVRDTLGKSPVRAPDRAGFIVNYLLTGYLVDAIRMYESGAATAEDIDTAMRLGLAHPMGPLALCDLIGNDTIMAVAESMYAEWGEPRHAPPPLLRRMVEGGRLGRKTGKGFYDYDYD